MGFTVLQGGGTAEQQYSVGNDMGMIIGTLLTGAGMKSLTKQINKAKWAKIGSTGIVGEKALKKLGGISQKYFNVKGLGGRYID